MNPTSKIKILLVDDHQLFSDGLMSLLSTETTLAIVGQVFDARNVLFEIQKATPQIVFLDINMPHKNGIELSMEIKRAFPTVKIIFLTMYSDAQIYNEAVRSGVNGYILKNSSKNELMAAIEAVENGLTYFDTKIKLTQEFEKKDSLAMTFGLTDREKQIIRMVREGLDSHQIAAKINLSYLTIKTHRRNIHYKLKTY
jgi:DNA-binding NarL/FixJ family response regulator